jgi:hypothetical protein
MRFPTVIIVAAVAMLTTLSTCGQMKPNLTGTWKLNLEKSKLSDGRPIPYYTEFLREIDHREPKLRTVEKIKTPPTVQADRTLITDFTIDGKETEAVVNGAPVKISAKWEGNTLVTSFAREAFTVVRKSTIAPDGKSISAEWILTQGAESRSATEIWEKL